MWIKSVFVSHLSRFSLGWLNIGQLVRCLQPPVTARWQDIGHVCGGARIGELLLTLPSLTTLHLTLTEDTAHVDFLPQLPQLTVLILRALKCRADGPAWRVPADALLASLVRCRGLTELDLCCGFNSAHWSALFAKLTIKKLTIRMGRLDTLQCFAAGPITQSLEELALEYLDLPSFEVSHLYGLRRLRTLHLQLLRSAPGRCVARLPLPSHVDSSGTHQVGPAGAER